MAPSKLIVYCPKGQLISKGLFCILKFFQRQTNKFVHSVLSGKKNEFVRLFVFWKNWQLEKNILTLSDLYLRTYPHWLCILYIFEYHHLGNFTVFRIHVLQFVRLFVAKSGMDQQHLQPGVAEPGGPEGHITTGFDMTRSRTWSIKWPSISACPSHIFRPSAVPKSWAFNHFDANCIWLSYYYSKRATIFSSIYCSTIQDIVV